MPAYTPQGLFPSIPLTGGGNVPAQIMLGIATQESNMWQAARYALPGVTGNPLIGNYYGLDSATAADPGKWAIHFDKADCGYGITQVTDGMRLAGKEKQGETALPYQTQRAVALDFAANIAAGLQIVQSKWNETTAAGLTVNNGDPSKIENWFLAVWAYNSGFHKKTTDTAPWGLGWANNPANPKYAANRTAFLDKSYDDARTPQNWPYPEKVLGWAGHPIDALEAPDTHVAGYRAAWWNGTTATAPVNRTNVKPPTDLFCATSNDCVYGTSNTPTAPEVLGEPAGPCGHKNTAGQFDLQCWFHVPASWKPDCATTCGNELLRFDPGYAYQDDATNYAPLCTTSGLPSGALIVDDVADDVKSVRPNCDRTWSNAGSFALSYTADSTGQYPGKIDTHQLGAGFGGHFWFTHTNGQDAVGKKLEVVGKWTLNQSHTGPMKVLVALPDHGAQTNTANYVVHTAKGDRTKTIKQPGTGNRWVSLGTYMFDGVPSVSLSNITKNGTGDQDIAYDALAFVPVNGTYHEESVEAVAEFDEDQNFDASSPASNVWLSGYLSDGKTLFNWASSKSDAILALPACASGTTDSCIPLATQNAISSWRDTVRAAGYDSINHPKGNSIGTWIGFSQPYTERPTSDQRPAWFDNDDSFKIKTKTTATFVTGDDGKIIDGSADVNYDSRTGHAHTPQIFRDLVSAMLVDYGVAPPDLTYTIADLSVHDGAITTANPAVDGVVPARAYASAGKAPVTVDSTGAPSTSNATCVSTLSTAGGANGFKSLLGQDGPPQAATAWVKRLESANVPKSIRQLADDLRNMFFDDSLLPNQASIFKAAPPIWQELNLKFCADGSIQKNSDRPLLRASYMPDQYLYHNGKAISLDGNFSGSSSPVVKGDFQGFSHLPIVPTSPYGSCDSGTDKSGNPWSIGPTDAAGTNPSPAHFCLDSSLPIDPAYSS